MLVHDVDPRQLARHDELLRQQSSADRMRSLSGLIEGVRTLAVAGIHQRQPGASEALVRWLLAELLYGAPVAERLLGARPSK